MQGMKTVWIKQGFNAYQDTSLIESRYQPDIVIDKLSGLKEYFYEIPADKA